MRFELMITAMSRQYPNQLDYRPTQENKILEGINSYKNYEKLIEVLESTEKIKTDVKMAKKENYTQVRISYFEKEDDGNQNNFSKTILIKF